MAWTVYRSVGHFDALTAADGEPVAQNTKNRRVLSDAGVVVSYKLCLQRLGTCSGYRSYRRIKGPGIEDHRRNKCAHAADTEPRGDAILVQAPRR